jgi:hypothetical protein
MLEQTEGIATAIAFAILKLRTDFGRTFDEAGRLSQGWQRVLPRDQRRFVQPRIRGELLHDEIRDIGSRDRPAMDA